MKTLEKHFGTAVGPGNMSQYNLETTSFMMSLTKNPQP